jgi:hypothetical protein
MRNHIGELIGIVGKNRRTILICRACGARLQDPDICPNGCRMAETVFCGRSFPKVIDGRFERIRRDARREL